MIRNLLLICVSAALCIQLLYLPTRGVIVSVFNRDRPYLKLPDASHSSRQHCRAVSELSFSKKGQWVTRGKDPMDDKQVQQHLEDVVAESAGRGRKPILRLRIPANAHAKHFIRMIHHAEAVGIRLICVAVWAR